MSRKFQRKIENFSCAHCGYLVEGTGYTNHCPECLWSIHVDVFPGDRAETCGGNMEPIGLLSRKGGFALTHRCLRCGEERVVKAQAGDKIEKLI